MKNYKERRAEKEKNKDPKIIQKKKKKKKS